MVSDHPPEAPDVAPAPSDHAGQIHATGPPYTARGNAENEHTSVVWAALLANVAIMIATYLVAGLTGSAAMFAAAIHSTAATGNQGLLLLGHHRYRQPPDARHPFGYGQELFFWGLVVAMILFGLGGGVSIWEGMSGVVEGGHAIITPGWSYLVLGIAFVAEGSALIYSVDQFNKHYPDTSFWRALIDSHDPRYVIPLVEDAAAELGIAIAAVGILLTVELQAPIFDAVASIAIGLILVVVAGVLARESRALLIGERMGQEAREAVARIAEEDPAIARVGRVMTMQLSPDEILATLEVELSPDQPEHESLPEVLERIEERIVAHHPRVTRLFIEPEPPPSE